MITENLERLKILDPALWETIQANYPIPEKRDWANPVIQGDTDKWQIDVKYAIEDSIQGCIQRAIAARIDHEAEKSRETWSYEIIADRDGYKALVGPRDARSFFAYGDSPAAALLAAYCEACQ